MEGVGEEGKAGRGSVMTGCDYSDYDSKIESYLISVNKYFALIKIISVKI